MRVPILGEIPGFGQEAPTPASTPAPTPAPVPASPPEPVPFPVPPIEKNKYYIAVKVFVTGDQPYPNIPVELVSPERRIIIQSAVTGSDGLVVFALSTPSAGLVVRPVPPKDVAFDPEERQVETISGKTFKITKPEHIVYFLAGKDEGISIQTILLVGGGLLLLYYFFGKKD